MPKKNPKFYWGASTAAHQVEGNNHNSWSEWEQSHAHELAKRAKGKYGSLPSWEYVGEEAQNPSNYISGASVDHYNRYLEDIEVMKELNLNAYRFSIEWSRIEPEDGKWDMNEVEHYREKIRALRKAGIEPFVTLWHWTHPLWFEHQGAWLSQYAVEQFARYVQFITRELAEEVDYWIILNEPINYTGQSYVLGQRPPQKVNYFTGLKVVDKLIKAHKKAYHYIKETDPEAMIGISETLVYFEPVNNSPITHLTTRFCRWFNQMYSRALHDECDFVGLNYYFRNKVNQMFVSSPESEKVSDLGWDLYPQGLYHVLKQVTWYNKPIIITENGVADARDTYRKWWIEESMKAIQKARDEGVDVFGYLHWSLMDNFEWDVGYWVRFGLVHIDYDTQKRTIRDSARWYARYISECDW